MLKPTLPPYDLATWKQQPFFERLRLVCLAWATQGYGTPLGAYLFYLFKIGFYIAGWVFFCSFTPSLGGIQQITTWWSSPIAFQKAILWSMAFEGLGLGCGSGPLTGRYLPPFGGALYFLRPHTTKMSLFPSLPLFGGHQRTYLDVMLYSLHYIFLFRALTAAQLDPSMLWPTVILLPLLGLCDKTIVLASRAEHYYTALVCFLFASQGLAASKWVWIAIWMWAATSKLNAHFPAVICVMTSNNPFANFPPLRKLMYRRFPEDLRPSKFAAALAHTGTLVEYLFPLTLLFSSGGSLTHIALLVMLLFHIFITSNVPMGVPIEWNVMMVYGAFVLFGQHALASPFSLQSPLLIAFLGTMLFLIPLLGNLFPAWISFLFSMRYYAGNWAYSVWLFHKDTSQKLDQYLTKSASRVHEQLAPLYDADTITAVLSKVIAFRAMHLHGRALQVLLPQLVDDLEAYEYFDGELLAGLVLGWNFGDGHLHNVQLMQAIQQQCNFREGELRCLFVESQPMGRPTLAWTLADAAKGPFDQGKLDVSDLLQRQPWPAPPNR